MADPWKTKIPASMLELAEAKVKALGVSKYTYLQQLVERDITVLPPIPKKKDPPPLPKKLPPARPPWEIFRKVHDFIVNGISKEDDLFKALVAEARRSKCPDFFEDLVKSELEKIRHELLDENKCLDGFQSTSLKDMEAAWRASLPKLKLGAPTVEEPSE